MENVKVFFCGLSKNSDEILIKNLEFLENYIIHGKFDSNLIIVDSDSNNEIKELLSNKSKNNEKITSINEDNLDVTIPSRIKRIAYCRNLCLKIVYENNDKLNKIYIPCDLDVDLFSQINFEFLDDLISQSVKHENSFALFPVSIPKYYDILALRSKNWVNFNSQLVNSKFKKIIKIGSFFWNYLFVFRYQWTVEKIRKRKVKINSAFGGIAIYNISALNEKVFYDYSKSNTEFISEHLSFNHYFSEKKMDTNWIVKAPQEHIYFHTLSRSDKINYFFKTLKYDIGLS